MTFPTTVTHRRSIYLICSGTSFEPWDETIISTACFVNEFSMASRMRMRSIRFHSLAETIRFRLQSSHRLCLMCQKPKYYSLVVTVIKRGACRCFQNFTTIVDYNKLVSHCSFFSPTSFAPSDNCSSLHSHSLVASKLPLGPST